MPFNKYRNYAYVQQRMTGKLHFTYLDRHSVKVLLMYYPSSDRHIVLVHTAVAPLKILKKIYGSTIFKSNFLCSKSITNSINFSI